MTTMYQSVWKEKDCHKGNSTVYTEPNGGTLYIGGWNNAAKFDWNTHVIDLTGSEHKFWDIPFAYDENSKGFLPFVGRSYAGWLSLPFPDYKVPASISTRSQWDGIAANIKSILQTGTDVLVACHGGHGRSGLFCAIVGYILAINTDRSWSSPVEKIRKIHCDDAVETFEQERFVYGILGLDIQIKHTYTKSATAGVVRKYLPCPICNKDSQFVNEYGMCLSCQVKYSPLAPTRADLTIEDIKHKGEVEHSCKREKCVGIWKAEKCGHVVHDQIIYEGLCQYCWDAEEAEKEKYAELADSTDEDIENVGLATCAVCGNDTMYAYRFGLCYDCAETLIKDGSIDYVHNTITDPYKAQPHLCDEVGCVGIVVADVCGHVVHNREVEDGICPECMLMDKKRQEVG